MHYGFMQPADLTKLMLMEYAFVLPSTFEPWELWFMNLPQQDIPWLFHPKLEQVKLFWIKEKMATCSDQETLQI